VSGCARLAASGAGETVELHRDALAGRFAWSPQLILNRRQQFPFSTFSALSAKGCVYDCSGEFFHADF